MPINYTSNVLLASFDILGYQLMIENNSEYELINSVGFSISQALEDASFSANELTRDVVSSLVASHTQESSTLLVLSQDINSRMKTYIVSDTIVSMMDVSNLEENEFKTCYADFFLSSCSLLVYKMFISGLPVRGAMDHGFCYSNRTVSFGYPILNAHRLSESLEFSGFVLSPKAQDYLWKVFDERSISTNKIRMLPAPTKGDPNIRQHCLDWTGDEFKCSDVRSLVFEKFSMFNKHVSITTMKKMENTELMIRSFLLEA